MNVEIGTLGWLVLALLGNHPPINEYGMGKTLCLVSVKTDAPRVVVVQADSTGRVLPFGTWHYGQTLCGQWAFRNPRGRFGYVVGQDTSWGAPL